MWTVEFHREAEEELAAATDWYAERNVAAAIAFAEEIREGIRSILSDPARLPTLGPEQHFYLLKRFPYLLPYRTVGTTIRVLAVAHVSRQPGFWRHRD